MASEDRTARGVFVVEVPHLAKLQEVMTADPQGARASRGSTAASGCCARRAAAPRQRRGTVRALVQRVTRARVHGRRAGDRRDRRGTRRAASAHAANDGAEDADWLARKVAELRVFADDEASMNRDVRETGGAALVMPQFTLYGDARRGRRPDFTGAARPEHAEPLFERFCAALADAGVPVARGVFRAHMAIELVNDGPVTLMIETPSRAERSAAGAERRERRRSHDPLLSRPRAAWCSPRPRRAGSRCCVRSGSEFTVADPGPDRAWPGAAEPRHGVRALALDKARRIAAPPAGRGRDRRGHRGGRARHAPRQARRRGRSVERCSRRLQGRTHEVWTGIAVVRGREQRTASERTVVQFARLEESELRRLRAHRRAARQGRRVRDPGHGGRRSSARIEGDHSNVVGLPLARLRQVLREFE